MHSNHRWANCRLGLTRALIRRGGLRWGHATPPHAHKDQPSQTAPGDRGGQEAPLLLSTVAWLCVLAAGCEQPVANPTPSPSPLRLTVVTPHNQEIRDVFAATFDAWYLGEHDRGAEIDWVTCGTPDCIEYVAQAATAQDQGMRMTDVAIMFGGGIADHMHLAEQGFSKPLSLGENLQSLPGTINGLPTRDETGRWYAVGLSTFGILFNNERIEQWGLDVPTTWADLAKPEYRGWIAIADPSASGSHRECMNLILQAHGWKDGWQIILGILANARSLDSRSSSALNQVASGTALATLAVNFDALALVEKYDGKLSFVLPKHATAATPSVVSALRTTTSDALAEEFVRFCLSDVGQSLWAVRGEHRPDLGSTLYTYPILPAVYAREKSELAVAENPYETSFGVNYDIARSQKYATLLEPLVSAICGRNHVALQQAWAKGNAPDASPAVLAAFAAPPCDETTALQWAQQLDGASLEERQAMIDGWSAMIAERLSSL